MKTQNTSAQTGWRYTGSQQVSNATIRSTGHRNRTSGAAWCAAYSLPAYWRPVGLLALLLVVGLCCLAAGTSSVVPKASDSLSAAPVIAERLANQQAEIDRLVSALRSSAQQPKVIVKSRKLDAPPRESKQDPATEAATQAALKDLAELSRYAKDVADSIAVIDTKLSDPAVLQKKLDQERAAAHQ